MKNRKRRMEFFSFYNHTAITAHLEKMARKGWMLEEIRNTTWIYRRIQPQKLHFAVSYYPKASEFDPEPTPEQQDFLDFCAHTGWKLVCLSAQMQIFCNEAEHPVPIDTDAELEVETIHAAVWKSFFPGQIVLLVMAIVILLLNFMGFLGNPLYFLRNSLKVFSSICWILVIFLVLTELIAYHRWHKKAEKAAENGIFLDMVNTTPIQIGAVVVLGICGGYLLLSYIIPAGPMMWYIMTAMVIYITALFALVNGIKRLLKRKKASRNVNRVVTIVMSFVLSFLMMSAVTFSALKLAQNGFFDEDQETYTYKGTTFQVHKDEIPLKVEDMMEADPENYSYERWGDGSFLVSEYKMTQQVRFDAENWTELPELSYRIVDVKMPLVYDICLNQLKKDLNQVAQLQIPYELRDKLVEIDPAVWSADGAWQVVSYELTQMEHYLLCYGNRFVDITFDWPVTEEQKAIVAEKLG